jgi:3-oxoacyl-[acyl-carrier-protein] synthase-3
MKQQVGILAAACRLPEAKRTVGDLCLEEGVGLTADIRARLGIQQVPMCSGERGSDMAVEASREALRKAGVDPVRVDVVVEYSILPQEYLVPVWNMSNKVQAEVGANKSFVVGFSGGGASNFLVALSSAVALLQENENLKTALLVTGDVTIRGNRVLNPADPVSVLGDSASAVVLQRGAGRGVVVDTELWSDGANHDICYIPGGSLAYPDDIELYRLQLNKPRYDAFPKAETLQRISQVLLERAGIELKDVAALIYTNVSAEDQREIEHVFGRRVASVCAANLRSHGHLQGTDLVLNYLSLVESNGVREGDYVLAASHGMGALAAASLIRC